MPLLAGKSLGLKSFSGRCGLGIIDASTGIIPESFRPICPTILYLGCFYGTTFLYGGRLGWLQNKNMVTFQCMAGCVACDLEFLDGSLIFNQKPLSACAGGYGAATARLDHSSRDCGAWLIKGASPFCSQTLFRLFPHFIASMRGLLTDPMEAGCGKTETPTRCSYPCTPFIEPE